MVPTLDEIESINVEGKIGEICVAMGAEEMRCTINLDLAKHGGNTIERMKRKCC